MMTATASTATLARLAAALTACLVLGSASNVYAADSSDAPTARVSFRDLNLATAEGSQALYRRIAAAAHEVCPVSDSRNVWQLAAQRSCESAAVAHAVQQINNPNLAALYLQHTRHG